MKRANSPKRKETSSAGNAQVSFSINPGEKVRFIIEAGREDAGKVPIKIHMDQAGEEVPSRGEKHGVLAGKPWVGIKTLTGYYKYFNLGTWLFILSLTVYLVTRLVGLTEYPIYFFADEAIQTQSMADLIANGYRDATGLWFPTYFRNGLYHNLSLSVYLQWLPLILFGKSALVTRATSVIVSLIAAVAIGIILRDVFKAKYWWTGTLFLSITPAWFLHSRTAFETAEFTAFYAGSLCAYLLYRYRSPCYLYLALFLGALAFYTYNPGQMIVPVTVMVLLISDWRYHWENRSTILEGLALTAILALPYIRFRFDYPDAPSDHLYKLGSYLTLDMPVSEKIARYFREYFIGLSPWYWFQPNDRDLQRHLMKDYGNIMIVTLPFALLGLAHALRSLRESAHRAILVVLLISPTAAALVQTGITRALAFVVPAAILTALGLERVLRWVESPDKPLAELGLGLGLTSRRALMAAFILMPGIFIVYISKEEIDRIAVSALALMLALQASGAFEWLAGWFTRIRHTGHRKGWHLARSITAVTVFIILAAANIHLLGDALGNGPLWYRNYDLGGMQYGAFQIFDVIKQYKQEHPGTRIIFSPNWANGTKTLAHFFLDDPLPFKLASVEGHINQKLSLNDNTLFIMTPREYDLVMNSGKFKEIRVERIFPYPDGTPGFYFVRLRYVDAVEEIFAAETDLRLLLHESIVTIDGQEVMVRHSHLDADAQAEAINLVFDNDPLSLAKTSEANPFVIELTFPAPREISGFSIIIGSVYAQITMKCYPTPQAQPIIYTIEGGGTVRQPELSFDLPESRQVRVLRLEMLDLYSPAPVQVHIWELRLR